MAIWRTGASIAAALLILFVISIRIFPGFTSGRAVCIIFPSGKIELDATITRFYNKFKLFEQLNFNHRL